PIDPTKSFTTVEEDVSEWTALLLPCYRYGYFVGCAAVQGGAIVAKGDRTEITAWGMLSFGPRVGFEVGFKDRFAVFGFGEALIRAFSPILKPFETREDGSLVSYNSQWVPSPLTGFFAVGLLVKLD